MPELAHLKALLAVPDELPARLAMQRPLALAKALQPRLGAGTSSSWTSHDVMEAIATRSGVLGERASYRDVLVWQGEQNEEDRAKLRAVHKNPSRLLCVP